MEIKNVMFCETDVNCSQIVFKAICENCGIKTEEKMADMLNGISAGFGINGICSALVGGLCALGLFYSEEEMKSIRLMLFMDFSEKFSSLSCGRIWPSGENCEEIMSFVQKWAEEKIREKNNAIH